MVRPPAQMGCSRGGSRAPGLGGCAAGVAFAWALASASCTSSDPAQAAAERFLDRHYVEMDLAATRETVTGVARAKVDEELRLVEGQLAANGPPGEDSFRPSVSYRLIDSPTSATPDRRSFVYDATIRVDGGQIGKRLLVSVRQEEAGWRVSNFQEQEPN